MLGIVFVILGTTCVLIDSATRFKPLVKYTLIVILEALMLFPLPFGAFLFGRGFCHHPA